MTPTQQQQQQQQQQLRKRTDSEVGGNAAPVNSTTQPSDAMHATHTAAVHEWEIVEKDVEVVERIGRGAAGEVYRGRLWGTDVAVKLLVSAAITADLLSSLKAEVSILSQLRHPNVVLYLGACTTPPNIFIVTEWCERGSLSSMLYDSTLPLSVANRLGMALQTAQGMCYLHAAPRKIIHRDLKSHNLLVTRDFTVKVADFGLTVMRTAHGLQTPVKQAADTGDAGAALVSASKVSKPTPQRATASLEAAGGLLPFGVRSSRALLTAPEPSSSGSGQRMESAPELEEGEFYGVQGTPQWMAPEVMEGQRYNSSVDVYSYGVVLCELVSRILPFSDVYKRFDFIEAVLEEGAIPTIPRWCDTLPDAPPVWASDSEDADLCHDEMLPWGWREDLTFIAGALKSLTAAAPPAAVMQPLFGFTVPASALPLSPQMPASSSVPDTPLLQTPMRRASADMRFCVGALSETGGSALPGAGASGSAPPSGATPSAAAKSVPMPVLGDVNEWSIERGDCTGVLRLLIESCLSRDPDSRPTFEACVDVVRALVDRPTSQLFAQLEVPRLREALAYGDDTTAAVAANEIVHLSSYALFCKLPVLSFGTGMPYTSMASSLAVSRELAVGGGVASPALDAEDGGGNGNAGSSDVAARGLAIRFKPHRTAFYPLLPFAP
ncbi:MAG: protein kinase, partial [Methanobacteriota archaeon]